MHHGTYPPGADIGLHESVIHSITSSGNTNFLWNFYQMGGGISLTFPGYHIFVSYIAFMTGIPDYLAHFTVAALFSAFTVICAFLITKTIWNEAAALIAAFLVAISRFDIEMLMWGGYPNVITLTLIPLTLYMFLQKPKISIITFLVSTALLSSAIFLTHSLSSAIFTAITVATLITAAILTKTIGTQAKQFLMWLAPLLLGSALISPFLLQLSTAYTSASSNVASASIEIQQAILSTRILPAEIVFALLALFPLFFIFSKKHTNKFLTAPALLLALWILIPTILTQGFIIGLYIDYHRFLYFVLLPVIILIAIAIDHGANSFAYVIDTHRVFAEKNVTAEKHSRSRLHYKIHVTRKTLYVTFTIGLLLFSFLAVPIFLTPDKGRAIAEFYQTMDEPGYDTLKWIGQKTPNSSVLAADAYYGWWLSGFTQRPTLSAVDPQYLTLTREFEPARIAKNLLDTDYIIDNGLVQVREDGGYIGRHNPMFLTKLNWTYFPYPFLHFDSSFTMISVRIRNSVEDYDLMELPVKQMSLKKSYDHATISVIKGNNEFTYKQLITVYGGECFVNMTVKLESNVENVIFENIHFKVYSKGYMITATNETIGLLDEGVKAVSQLIFFKGQPRVYEINRENPCILELMYDLRGAVNTEIQLAISTSSVTDNHTVYKTPENIAKHMNELFFANLTKIQRDGELKARSTDNSNWVIFDYQEAVKNWSISYVVCRDADVISKFAADPTFDLIRCISYHGDNSNGIVALFKVKRNLNKVVG
ncbi:MAG: hypothetical protein QXU99_06650 [Candidatus Bathyarchaeia archaeon]